MSGHLTTNNPIRYFLTGHYKNGTSNLPSSVLSSETLKHRCASWFTSCRSEITKPFFFSGELQPCGHHRWGLLRFILLSGVCSLPKGVHVIRISRGPSFSSGSHAIACFAYPFATALSGSKVLFPSIWDKRPEFWHCRKQAGSVLPWSRWAATPELSECSSSFILSSSKQQNGTY